MTAPAARLAALREKLEAARGENLQAVEEEARRPVLRPGMDAGGGRERARKRRRAMRTPQGGAGEGEKGEGEGKGEGEDEEDDAGMRSMMRRAKRLPAAAETGARSADGGGEGDAVLVRGAVLVPGAGQVQGKGVLAYGGNGGEVEAQNADRMVEELQEMDERRGKFRRRRAFHEDREDISFINESNRKFNRTLDKHYNKFESVRTIKESLERGTALP